MDAYIKASVSQCPFLREVSARSGETYARRVAINPTVPAAAALGQRTVLEEWTDFAFTFQTFHGASGVVPLREGRVEQALVSAAGSATGSKCPFQHSARTTTLPVAPPPPPPAKPAVVAVDSGLGVRRRNALAGAPLASMSLGMPNFGDFMRNAFGGGGEHRPAKPRPQQQQRPSQQPQQRPPPPPQAAAPGAAAAAASSSGLAPGHAAGGLCPMRKLLGPFAGVVFNKAGHIQCPEAIVQARAALARTQVVRELRPQVLPVKLLAVGLTTLLLNVPFGAAREHTEKFSLGWFVAVHATIPFIAMLRKAVVMPKTAILLTVAAAVAGQAIGARLERKRIAPVVAAAVDPGVPAVAAAPAAAAAKQRLEVPSASAGKAMLLKKIRRQQQLQQQPQAEAAAALASLSLDTFQLRRRVAAAGSGGGKGSAAEAASIAAPQACGAEHAALARARAVPWRSAAGSGRQRVLHAAPLDVAAPPPAGWVLALPAATSVRAH